MRWEGEAMGRLHKVAHHHSVKLGGIFELQGDLVLLVLLRPLCRRLLLSATLCRMHSLLRMHRRMHSPESAARLGRRGSEGDPISRAQPHAQAHAHAILARRLHHTPGANAAVGRRQTSHVPCEGAGEGAGEG